MREKLDFKDSNLRSGKEKDGKIMKNNIIILSSYDGFRRMYAISHESFTEKKVNSWENRRQKMHGYEHYEP